MKHPVKAVYEDPKVDTMARDVILALNRVPNFSVIKVKTAWRPPLDLAVPYVDGTARVTSPDVVKCERAVSTTTPTAVITPGGISWTWKGNKVQIHKIEGLETGQNYELTFMVVGG